MWHFYRLLTKSVCPFFEFGNCTHKKMTHPLRGYSHHHTHLGMHPFYCHKANSPSATLKLCVFLSLTLVPPLLRQRQTALECFHGSWDRVVSCQPVDCGLPDQSHVYHAIFSCPWGTTFGKQCSFTCGSPAILQGKLWMCLFNGSWTNNWL